MKPKTLGIIGGAGPIAGVKLLERIFSLAISGYGCSQDNDFPQVFFISFPFSQMLTQEIDAPQIRRELNHCLNQLRQNGSEVLAIACNTLHAFLEGEPDDLIHLPKITKKALPEGVIPLVLCTSTSVRSEVHREFFPCRYPEPEIQLEIDLIIERILKGEEKQAVAEQLAQIAQPLGAQTVVLGCTELSFMHELNLPGTYVIDPLELLANQALKISFSKG